MQAIEMFATQFGIKSNQDRARVAYELAGYFDFDLFNTGQRALDVGHLIGTEEKKPPGAKIDPPLCSPVPILILDSSSSEVNSCYQHGDDFIS